MSLYRLSRPGDLLLYRTTKNESSRASRYDHVAILEHDFNHCIEARWPRIKISSVDWDADELELWRVNMTPTQIERVIDFARTQMGRWYGAGQLLLGILRSKNSIYGTTLVRDSFAAAGIVLGSGAGDCMTPNELVAYLSRIG